MSVVKRLQNKCFVYYMPEFQWARATLARFEIPARKRTETMRHLFTKFCSEFSQEIAKQMFCLLHTRVSMGESDSCSV